MDPADVKVEEPLEDPIDDPIDDPIRKTTIKEESKTEDAEMEHFFSVKLEDGKFIIYNL